MDFKIFIILAIIVLLYFVYCYQNRIEKKKYKEIAELLDISVKAVEKRIHQALLVMRKEIGNI